LNYERLEKRKQDPNFLYENVKLCGECYDMFKMVLPLTKTKKNSLAGVTEADLKLRNLPLPSLPKT
jgi:hypothetical protein